MTCPITITGGAGERARSYAKSSTHSPTACAGRGRCGMFSFPEDQGTIAEALRRPKSRGNPWRSERGEAMLETRTRLNATPIKWHWDGRLARGNLLLLASSKATGQTTVVV